MTDHEKYMMAIDLAKAAAVVTGSHYELAQRLAEVALQLLEEKQK